MTFHDNTAYQPYLYPPAPQSQPRDFASNGSGRESADSGATLTDASPARGVGVAVTSKEEESESADEEYAGDRKGRKKGGYESVGMADEYDGEGYEGHPLRVRSVREDGV